MLIAVLAACVGYSNLPRSPDRHVVTSQETVSRSGTLGGRVTRVVDGDTFRIDTIGTPIRVWGLDAPEVDQRGGSQATAALSRMIAGRNLSCRQHDIDQYGRVVGQCFLPDGRDITAAMIASGTANEYCRYSRDHYGTC
ncbi:thermonuclease family protein [uncultured Paracoccus sp.]|uniref:thermonuclease family protein n=1 Tax=uncultured Paracoccus sp. TaxID=189685 RepID=UPI0026097053|nr:thermonuclease family protein [uncultured Paracoccus sp.]